jgi:hypothetical protein
VDEKVVVVSGGSGPYKPGNEVSLKCVDQFGKKIEADRLKWFYIGSKNLVNRVDYEFTGKNTPNPVVRFLQSSKSGEVVLYCTVDDPGSPNHELKFRP